MLTLLAGQVFYQTSGSRPGDGLLVTTLTILVLALLAINVVIIMIVVMLDLKPREDLHKEFSEIAHTADSFSTGYQRPTLNSISSTWYQSDQVQLSLGSNKDSMSKSSVPPGVDTVHIAESSSTDDHKKVTGESMDSADDVPLHYGDTDYRKLV